MNQELVPQGAQKKETRREVSSENFQAGRKGIS